MSRSSWTLPHEVLMFGLRLVRASPPETHLTLCVSPLAEWVVRDRLNRRF